MNSWVAYCQPCMPDPQHWLGQALGHPNLLRLLSLATLPFCCGPESYAPWYSRAGYMHQSP